MEFSVDQVIAGKYRLEQPIAQGGMGSLWAANDVVLERRVAIKFMAPSAAESSLARARFELEARAAARIRSPHVIQIHDYGHDRDGAYIVMELLAGEDLGSRLAAERRLSFDEVASLLGQMAQGLDAVHAAGIVHRDLKPSNVFLASSGWDEMAKLLDFGIAKAKDSIDMRLTAPGIMLGTPKYMSPEQLLDLDELDHRADLWSLAAVVYRMLTGEDAFRGGTLGAVFESVCHHPLRLPSQVVDDLPRGVDGFFARALVRDPARRFQSARELAMEFAAIGGKAALRSLPAPARLSMAPARPSTAPGPTIPVPRRLSLVPPASPAPPRLSLVPPASPAPSRLSLASQASEASVGEPITRVDLRRSMVPPSGRGEQATARP